MKKIIRTREKAKKHINIVMTGENLTEEDYKIFLHNFIKLKRKEELNGNKFSYAIFKI